MNHSNTSTTSVTDHNKNATIITSPSNGMASTRSSGSLMNSNGQIIYRNSPISSNNNQHQPQSYSPSVTSFNSEEISETISSLDEDSINDLTQKFDRLQRKIDVLTETQVAQDEKYRRSKHENDLLQNRIHNLEDALRDLELNSENRAKEDEKRLKEAISKHTKVQRECDQHLQAIFQLQQDLLKKQNDLSKSESLIKSLRSDREQLESELQDKTSELTSQDEEIHKLKLLVRDLQDEETRKSNIISILNEELEDNQNMSHQRQISSQFELSSQNEQLNSSLSRFSKPSSPSFSSMTNNISNNSHHQPTHTISSSPKQQNQRYASSRRTSITSGFEEEILANSSRLALKDIDGLETSLEKLKEECLQLKAANEELQAQLLNAQLEQGRCLVHEGNRSYSLADEMGDIDEIKKALKQEQDVNNQLRKYMDEILSKIVLRNPELLDKTGPRDHSDQNISKRQQDCSPENNNNPSINACDK